MFVDPVLGALFGPTFGCQNWALEFGRIRNIRRNSFGPQKSTPQLEQNLDPKNRPQNWTPKIGPENQPQNWTPKMDPRTRPQNWSPEIGPQLDPRSGPQSWIPQLDTRVGTRPKIMALTWEPELASRSGRTSSSRGRYGWLVGAITLSTELQVCTNTCFELPDSQQDRHETVGLAKKLKAGEQIFALDFLHMFS